MTQKEQQPATPEFNAENGSLDAFFARAQNAFAPYLLIKNPAQPVYDRFAEATDQYAAALVKQHGSLDAYIVSQVKKVVDLAAPKGVGPGNISIERDSGQIGQMTEAIKSGETYKFDRESFAQFFLLQLPEFVERAEKILSRMPDKPAPAASEPGTPKA